MFACKIIIFAGKIIMFACKIIIIPHYFVGEITRRGVGGCPEALESAPAGLP